MDSDIATEALLQRGRTPLYKDLVSLYQRTQDALVGLKNASPEEYVHKLNKLQFPTDLAETIYTHTGLIIGQVFLVRTPMAGAFSNAMLKGKDYKQITDNKNTIHQIVSKVNLLYDDKEGKIERPKKSNPGLVFIIGLYMGLWRYRRPDNSYYFTAENIAAITLHELGHCDIFMKTLGAAHRVLEDVNDVVTYIRKEPDVKVIRAILDHLDKSKYLDRSWRPILKSVTDEFLSKTTHSVDEYEIMVSAIETLLAADVSDYQVVTMNASIWTGKFEANLATVKTGNYRVEHERLADEYAARHGSYDALVEAMQKLDNLPRRTTNPDIVVNDWSVPSVILGISDEFKVIFGISNPEINARYDTLSRRLELIIQAAKHAFANPDLPKEVVDDLKSQIANAEKTISDINKSGYQQARMALRVWRQNISKFGRISLSPLVGRMELDYGRLQDATRDISRNSLYYLARK